MQSERKQNRPEGALRKRLLSGCAFIPLVVSLVMTGCATVTPPTQSVSRPNMDEVKRLQDLQISAAVKAAKFSVLHAIGKSAGKKKAPGTQKIFASVLHAFSETYPKKDVPPAYSLWQSWGADNPAYCWIDPQYDFSLPVCSDSPSVALLNHKEIKGAAPTSSYTVQIAQSKTSISPSAKAEVKPTSPRLVASVPAENSVAKESASTIDRWVLSVRDSLGYQQVLNAQPDVTEMLALPAAPAESIFAKEPVPSQHSIAVADSSDILSETPTASGLQQAADAKNDVAQTLNFPAQSTEQSSVSEQPVAAETPAAPKRVDSKTSALIGAWFAFPLAAVGAAAAFVAFKKKKSAKQGRYAASVETEGENAFVASAGNVPPKKPGKFSGRYASPPADEPPYAWQNNSAKPSVMSGVGAKLSELAKKEWAQELAIGAGIGIAVKVGIGIALKFTAAAAVVTMSPVTAALALGALASGITGGVLHARRTRGHWDEKGWSQGLLKSVVKGAGWGALGGWLMAELLAGVWTHHPSGSSVGAEHVAQPAGVDATVHATQPPPVADAASTVDASTVSGAHVPDIRSILSPAEMHGLPQHIQNLASATDMRGQLQFLAQAAEHLNKLGGCHREAALSLIERGLDIAKGAHSEYWIDRLTGDQSWVEHLIKRAGSAGAHAAHAKFTCG